MARLWMRFTEWQALEEAATRVALEERSPKLKAALEGIDTIVTIDAILKLDDKEHPLWLDFPEWQALYEAAKRVAPEDVYQELKSALEGVEAILGTKGCLDALLGRDGNHTSPER